ncbi:hypothetical protein ACG04R_16425 [Roseateles sp. BYS78W]|uniref:Uncharacterized protein n=1 Tax=Pelomonas candidula TaxID=3299025 RepID=A0ABW7HES5_9BURK
MTKVYAYRSVVAGKNGHGDEIAQEQVLEISTEADRKAAIEHPSSQFGRDVVLPLYPIASKDELRDWAREFALGVPRDLELHGVNCRMLVVFDHG